MEERMITVSKTQICEKYIEEADKMMDFLAAVKNFCNSVILEQEQEECGYRGDGANDPDNICCRCPKFQRPLESVELLHQELIPAEEIVKDNEFLQLERKVPTLLELIDNNDRIKFPESLFVKKNTEKAECDVEVFAISPEAFLRILGIL